MKAEHRHQLQTNELADWLADSIETAKPYSKAILGVCLAVVVIVGTSWFISSRAAKKHAAGWDQFFQGWASGDPEALRDTVDRHAGTPAAQWAQLLVADQELQQGVDLLFNDRPRAKEQLEKAVSDYDAVRGQSAEPIVKQRATLGLAKAQEALGKTQEARGSYKELVEQWPDSPFSRLAERRLEDLDRQSTKSFYDWFAKWTPPPPVKGPGTPGQTPGLDLDLPFTSDALPSVFEDAPAPEKSAAPAKSPPKAD